MSDVFPAPAGINRGYTVPLQLQCGVPRASGDKPSPRVEIYSIDECSPRQRG
ncbi:hypothetical protein IBP34_000202 [Salmonella enterica]|nr:hypothetical protein [Salmonella enterica]